MRFPTSIPKRISNFTTSRSCVYRSLHTKQAEFITLDHKGSLVTQNVNVDLGHAHQAFTMLPKEIGYAFRAGIYSSSGSFSVDSLARDADQCPLTFYHDSRYFAHGKLSGQFCVSLNNTKFPESLPYPRLVIPQDFPRQSDANTSPATLHTFGATHTITLDGTFDGKAQSHLNFLCLLTPASKIYKSASRFSPWSEGASWWTQRQVGLWQEYLIETTGQFFGCHCTIHVYYQIFWCKIQSLMVVMYHMPERLIWRIIRYWSLTLEWPLGMSRTYHHVPFLPPYWLGRHHYAVSE